MNDRDVLLQATSPRLTAPEAGAALLLTVDTPVFHVSTSGAGSPAAINFKATQINLPGTVQWSCSAGGVLSGSGNTRSLAYSAMSVQQVTVTATLLHDSGVTFTAQQIVNKVQDGVNGVPGSNGSSGKSARQCFTLIDGYALAFNPASVTVQGDAYPPVGTWGETRPWGAAINGAPAERQVWFQSSGNYDPVTNQTVWTTPFQSYAKFGSLEAISTKTGALTFSDTCKSENGNVAINADGTFLLRSQGNERMELTPKGFYLFSDGKPVIELGVPYK
ncbi:hypothetical protein [Janthinobacterium sp. GW458P]|uniref:hypothetical protein n=1 Tax=Janthinobacterium sp. GW458P TaxID=1981504 RepID=UPI0011247223|nr:hypothetical protein [Janthinobacterium sp. GW458P]MBE3025706.1 hypothetical protein [Janthinobacterium sp. GW458P]